MVILGSKVKEKELSRGQFFVQLPMSPGTMDKTAFKPPYFFFIPLFKIQNFGERLDFQVGGNGFDLKVLWPENQRMMQLKISSRQALLDGESASDLMLCHHSEDH